MASSPQHEPTMEEILASIRKIISEDSSEPQAAPAVEAKSAPAPVDSDVLELTQEVAEPVPAPAPAPVFASVQEPVRPSMPSLPENDVVFEPAEEPAVTNEPVGSSHEGIFSDKTRKALDDAFANLDSEPQELAAKPAPRAPLAAAVDGATVEAVFERAVREAFEPVVNQWLGSNADLIVERMKPLIRDWMDEHFPALLEGAVRDEVARVAKARAAKR